MKIAFIDSTGCLWDEGEPVAKWLGREKEYEEKRDSLLREDIPKYVKLLRGKYDSEIMEIMEEAKPYKGSLELIKLLKNNGYKVEIITDNPLASIPTVEGLYKRVLGIDEVYATVIAELDPKGRFTGNSTFYKSKPEIIEELVKIESPEKIIGVFQGKNDIPAAKKVKELGGTVYAVNSNSEELKEIADLWAETMEKLYSKVQTTKVLKTLDLGRKYHVVEKEKPEYYA